MVSNARTRNEQNGGKNYKIARLTLVDVCDEADTKTGFKKRVNLVNRFCAKHSCDKAKFLITPGGFLRFNTPDEYKNLKLKDINNKNRNEIISSFQAKAAEEIKRFMSNIDVIKLSKIADFFIIGIDNIHKLKILMNADDVKGKINIQLVAIYDLRKKRIVHWTGKSYPTFPERRVLIQCDLNSHIFKAGSDVVAILGCHDLNIYSPRGNASVKDGSDRAKLIKKFKATLKKAQPQIVLQHPHVTDSPNIWRNAWIKLIDELPCVKHYASGINYQENNARGKLLNVLAKTKSGEVLEF